MEYVLGIDSSLSSTGWAILTKEKRPKLISYGKIRTEKDKKEKESKDLIHRYELITKELDKLFETCKINSVVIEQPNTSRNLDITRKLVGLYQIIKFYIYLRNSIYVEELNTKTVKKFVSGSGNADKFQMVQAINRIFKTKFRFSENGDSDDDICDAISVAYVFIKS